MLVLTKEQHREVSQAHGATIEVFDPETNQVFVLVPKDSFERLKGLLHDDQQLTTDELRWQLARSAEENGWNEPKMDEYDDYDHYREKSCESNAAT